MNKLFKKLSKNPIQSILVSQLFVNILCLLICYSFFPYLLNYPPNSINTEFQLTVNPTYYAVYYFAIFGFGILIDLILTYKMIKPIQILQNTKASLEEKITARKTCFSFTNKSFLITVFLLPIIVCIGALVLTNTNIILSIKIGLLTIAFLGIPNLFMYFFSNAVLKEVLISTFDKQVFENEVIKKSSLNRDLIIQIFSTILISMSILFLFIFSNITREFGDYKYNTYKSRLDDFTNSLDKNISINKLNDSMSLEYKDASYFVISDNKTYGTELSKFMKSYMDFYAKTNGGRLYDDFGIDKQGVVNYITVDGELVLVGLIYTVVPTSLFVIPLVLMIIFLVINLLIIYLSSKAMEKDLNEINTRLNEIAKQKKIIENLLPITSSNEIGTLTIAFNNIQKLTKDNLTTIRSNQDLLIERERLASLGQLIGGIAHNLKTPIMSISGAAEGLNDLIDEYDSSIEDPTVNYNDHHDIAKDMKDWTGKIKEHTSYMSDIITTVKGQAVVLSEEDEYLFTIDELIKKVTILMKHELKNALIELKTEINVPLSTPLKGNVNTLVQVINNMISNSIQAYNGKENEKILLTINSDKSNIYITIEDFAGGIPENIKDKLFKKMITTKGKNGTGLGLFMSYSTIRAHFDGDISFNSVIGKGTTFNIKLPIK